MLKRFLLVVAALCLVITACEGGSSSPKAVKKFDTSKFTKYVLKSAPTKYDVVANINYDNKVKLLGIDYEPKPLKHGQRYTVTFYFEVMQPIPGDYQFFGHFEAKSGRPFRAKMDHYVLGGKYPTSQWKKGDILKDVFRGTMPAGLPGKEGILWGGFFSGDHRLPLVGSDKADKENRGKIAVLPLDEPKLIKRSLTVYKTAKPLAVDGKLNEAAWAKASETDVFTNVGGTQKVKPETRAKFLWDNQYLYIAFNCDDPDIWTSYKKHDDPLYKEETTEVMIDADGSGSTYYEFQVNPLNAVYDAYFPERRKNRDLKWSSNLKSAVSVDGTVNKREDKDKSWTVEMAIPLAAIKDAPNTPPKNGDKWRLNLYRMEHPKKGGTTAGMWSPVYVGDFHILNRFGTIVFSDKLATNSAKPVVAPAKPAKK